MKPGKIHIQSILISWLPVAFIVILLGIFTYLVGQQILRQSANDPQIELSETVANSLSKAEKPNVPSNKVEISKSLGLYVMIYNSQKKLLYSTALLYGKNIKFPLGVLSSAQKTGQSRVTWQPAPGVRQATVTTYFHGRQSGYVVVGKSLRETEKRIDNLGIILGFTLTFGLLGSLFIATLTYLLKS